MNQIRAIIDTAPDEIRDRHRNLTPVKLIRSISRARPNTARVASPAAAAAISLRVLGRRWQFLTEQITDLDDLLDDLVATTAPTLIAVYCVGTDTAAALLVAAGEINIVDSPNSDGQFPDANPPPSTQPEVAALSAADMAIDTDGSAADPDTFPWVWLIVPLGLVDCRPDRAGRIRRRQHRMARPQRTSTARLTNPRCLSVGPSAESRCTAWGCHGGI